MYVYDIIIMLNNSTENLEYHFGNNNCGKYQPVPVNNEDENIFVNVYNTSYKIRCFDRLTVVYPGQSYEGSIFKFMVETNDTSSKQFVCTTIFKHRNLLSYYLRCTL